MILDLTREIAFFGLITACAYTDIARGQVYNHLTLPAIVLGLVLAAASALAVGSWAPLVASAAGLAIGFGALYLFFRAGQLGGGDVKLMAAVGALQGYPRILSILFFAALVGSVLGIGAALWRGQLWKSLRGAGRTLVLRPDAPQLAEAETGGLGGPVGPTIPFGFAIAAGGIWAWILYHGTTLAR